MKKQLLKHPSIVPSDIDISPETGELFIDKILEGNAASYQDDHSYEVVGPRTTSTAATGKHMKEANIPGISNHHHQQLQEVHPPSSLPVSGHHQEVTTVSRPPPQSISGGSRSGSQEGRSTGKAGQMVLNTEFTQVESIELINDGSGLGFGIVGGKSTGVVVKTLVPGGVADRDARMQVGDHILSIADVNLRGRSSEQVAQVLRSQGTSEVRLILARPVPDPQTVRSTGISAVVPTRIIGDLNEVHKRLAAAAEALSCIREPLPVPPPGFGDDSPSSDITHPFLTREAFDRQEGSLITNATASSSDVSSVIHVPLKKSSIGEDMSHVPPPPDFGLLEEDYGPEMETFEVELVKDHQGLGITIAGYVCEKEEISGIFVRSVAPGSAADMSQKIAVNDQIIEVDGQSLFGYSNHQTVEVLRKSGKIVKLRLARYLRGTKYEQLQQAIASTDIPGIPGHPVVPPPPPNKPVYYSSSQIPITTTTSSSSKGSTIVQVKCNPEEDRKLSLTSDMDSEDMELPLPPPSVLLPSVPTTSSSSNNYYNLSEVKQQHSLETARRTSNDAALIREWSQKLGPDFVVIVAHIMKFRESSGLGISLEGTVDIEEGQEPRPHHYIRAILSDGPVGVEGSLMSGDEILEVNGIELISMNHVEVVSLLKELPIKVDMVCARKKAGIITETRKGTTTICLTSSNTSSPEQMGGSDSHVNKRGTNIISISNNNNNNNEISVNKNNIWITDNNHKRTPTTSSTLDRLVKAKSDGSLAVGLGNSSGIGMSPVVLTDDSSRIRSRSLEPLTGLAMWSSEPLLIELFKGERGLGFSILDYQDPMNPSDTVIVVRSLVPGGVAQTDGRLIPGDRLISVNGVNLENASLDEAVQALKGAPRGVVQIQVAKPLPLPESEAVTASLHPDYFMISSRS